VVDAGEDQAEAFEGGGFGVILRGRGTVLIGLSAVLYQGTESADREGEGLGPLQDSYLPTLLNSV